MFDFFKKINFILEINNFIDPIDISLRLDSIWSDLKESFWKEIDSKVFVHVSCLRLFVKQF